MAQAYTLRSFLKRAPNSLLQAYLTEQLGLEIPWHKLSEASVDEIIAGIEAAPEDTRQRIEDCFRDIHGMADEAGVRGLVTEGHDYHHDVDLSDVFESMGGHLECAFWAFLNHPRLFRAAKRLHEAEHLPRSRKRDRLPAAEPATDQATADELGRAISEYYKQKEGRGYASEVERYQRGGRLYWFAYVSDYAESRLVFEKQVLAPQTQRPAFEIVFVHSPSERSLEVSLRGDKNTLLDLQCIFGGIVLGVDLRFKDPSRLRYDLSGLLRRNFPFPIEPDVGVDAVSVRKLRLRVIGSSNERLTLEANTKHNPGAVYDLLDKVTASTHIPTGLLQVTSARLALAFRASGMESARTLTFDVSTPDSLGLKHEPRHDIARQLLKRWGIDVSGSAEDDAADARRPISYTNRL